MILNTIGGLCNRLHALMGYRAVHRSNLKAVWLRDEVVSSAGFLDVFEPLAGVYFLENGSRWDAEDWHAPKDAPTGWESSYADLVPRSEIRERVRLAREELGVGYAAAHVRRTDHVKHSAFLGGTTPDDAFTSWLGFMPGRVHLATDNLRTWERYRVLMGDRMRSSPLTHFLVDPPNEETELPARARHTSLADAVVDLYVCAGARYFMGSNFSSFSYTVDLLRGLRSGWVSDMMKRPS